MHKLIVVGFAAAAVALSASTTREITAEMMSPVVGIAHVTLFQGRTKLDLWIDRKSVV